MSKFEQAHIEFRLYAPLEAKSWKAFLRSGFGKELIRSGLITIQESTKTKQGGKTNAKS